MNLTILDIGKPVSKLAINGQHFAYVTGADQLKDEHYKVVLSHVRSIGQTLPLLVGADLRIHDGMLPNGLQIGFMCGDDFVLNGRAALASLVNRIDLALDELEMITIDVVGGVA